jgi:hypothetical protein
MKKLVLGLMVAAFAAMPAFAGEGKECKEAKACDSAKVAKAASCETSCCAAKQAALKKGFNPSANKGAMQLVKR